MNGLFRQVVINFLLINQSPNCRSSQVGHLSHTEDAPMNIFFFRALVAFVSHFIAIQEDISRCPRLIQAGGSLLSWLEIDVTGVKV